MPSPPCGALPLPFSSVPEVVGRLDALRFNRPYPVFDVHHVLDRMDEEQVRNLRHGLEFYRLPWGICSLGPGKIYRWVDDVQLRPLLEGAAFIAVSREHSDRSGHTEDHHHGRSWRHQSGRLELEVHRAYRDLNRPFVPYAHAIVAGNKGDVARLLSGPSVLFDDKPYNCEDWIKDGHELNEAICVEGPERAIFSPRVVLPEERVPTQHGRVATVSTGCRRMRAEHVNRWLVQILGFVERAEVELKRGRSEGCCA